jgi:hypothetical protein
LALVELVGLALSPVVPVVAVKLFLNMLRLRR